MKKKFTEIEFKNSQRYKSDFDLVRLEDVLRLKPKDHNQFEFHRVSFYAILLCTDRYGEYNLNFKDYSLKKGSLFTFRKDNIHKFYRGETKGYLLVFNDNFVLSHTNETEASKTFLLFNEMLASPKLQLNEIEYNEIKTLIDLIKEEYFNRHDDYSVNIVRSYLQVIIIKLFRIKSKDNVVLNNQKYLSRFLEFQALVEKECFSNKKVAYYAQKMGLTTKTLNNITQSIIHKSAKTLINEIVIIHSKRLIINGDESLTEIAFQVGFDDPTNFFKYFKKYSGLSPNEFRNSLSHK